MLTLLLATYGAVVVVFLAHTSHRLINRPLRSGSLLRAEDHVLVVGAALLGAAAWPLLLTVYVAGWFFSLDGRAARHEARRRLGGWRRARLSPAG